MTALYNRDILRLASNLAANDRLEAPHGSAEVNSKTCGSRIIADVNLDKTGRVIAAAFRTHACAVGQASAAILHAKAVGETADTIAQTRTEIAAFLIGNADMPSRWPDLATLNVAREYPARHAAVLLPYDALLSAIKNAL